MEQNIKQDITETLENNYMPYAMSVILSRAIPAIDGFKPAHRKLLYTMYKMGLLNGNRTKSTNIVGQTMKLNPHGDASIYETMVRLSRGNNSLLHSFIDSKGNFGKVYSKDMAYAASRYTEAKLDNICNEIFKDIDKEIVDMVDNYDGTLKEPTLLPTTFPNIITNPNQGIAVSMASTICPFNLKEVCDTLIRYIKNNKVDITKYLKAPDFPTGGELIYNHNDISNIYKTGKGSFKVRAKYKYDKKNNIIDIYEIPYTTNIETIVDKIITLVKNNKIKEINDVRNETDLSGLKITIDLKRGTEADKLMNKLYQLTPLMDSFSCNFNILVNNKPRVMGITDIFDSWLDFRKECIIKQCKYDLSKKKERLYLLEGLSKISSNINKVIKIIHDTENENQVIPNLIQAFKIDEVQASYITDIRLRNLNKEYLDKKMQDIDILKNEIVILQQTIEDDNLINNIIIEDLKRVSKLYGKDRITSIVNDNEINKITEDEYIEDYKVKVFLTKEGYFKKISLNSLRMSGEQKLKDKDKIIQELEASNKEELLLFSDKCNVYKLKLYEITEGKASVMGDYLNNILNMEDNEKIIYMTNDNNYKGYMLFAFENGKVSKIDMQAYYTKQARKKLINAYGNKSKIINILYVKNNDNVLIKRNDNKGFIVNIDIIPVRQSKSSNGLQVLKVGKNTKLKSMQLITNVNEKYLINNIPNTGVKINSSLF